MFNESGYMYILRRNGGRFDLTTERDGNGNWSVVWSQPENICVSIGGELGSGACGFSSICPKGYSLLDENEKYGSCKADFELSCNGRRQGYNKELFDFYELKDTDWPMSDYELSRPYDEVQCKNTCLSDCFCAVAIFRGESCLSPMAEHIAVSMAKLL
ncbi:hypothetical protein AB3S75_007705 [Citrus x aurantiifolia]